MTYDDKERLLRNLGDISDLIRNKPFKGFQIEGYGDDHTTILMKVGEKVIGFRLDFIPEKNLKDYEHQVQVLIKDDEDKWV